MRVLAGYATQEGHTAEIARRVAAQIAAAGHAADLLPLRKAIRRAPSDYDRAILAAPVHLGRYHRDLRRYAARHADTLAQMPVLFLSVSLSAAGQDAGDWQGLGRVLDGLAAATGWRPARVEQVAGAYRPERYGWLARPAMRRVLAARDPGADPRKVHVYTDWAALERAVERFLAG
ncbi:flavodoxin domain-containing protein [Poseidonocella sp. HB161398]|uniref:flavodoxin domain-containing protein n=1 Tax=Poseidonocella sp. HB161398 TaxID=2320855 RepID=UPI0014867763|nr:flavodoxin domain-containing protein [Poseidonocella sp. HB161398]